MFISIFIFYILTFLNSDLSRLITELKVATKLNILCGAVFYISFIFSIINKLGVV